MKLAGRPPELIAHSAWSEAREAVVALVSNGPTLIALLGPPGTGKTALLRDLATSLAELGRAVCLLEFGDSPRDIGAADVVLVDEADRISASRLDELRGLKGVSVILAALPASRDRFASYPGANVIELPVLSLEEACLFVGKRLEQLGLPKRILTDAAWARLIAHGRGVPRLLVVLLGHALFLASEDEAAHVTAAHVDEAVVARLGDPQADTVKQADTAKPVRTEPVVPRDLVQARASAIHAGADGTASERGRDLIPAMPPPSRLGSSVFVGLYVAAVVAIYGIPAAALLTWGVPWHTGKMAPPGVETLVRTQMAADTARTDQVAAIAPGAAISTPVTVGEGPAGPGAADQADTVQPIPPPPVEAPIEPGHAASQQGTAQNQAPAAVVDRSTSHADGAGPAGPGAADQAATAQPVPPPPVAATIGPDNAASQQGTAQNQAPAEVVDRSTSHADGAGPAGQGAGDQAVSIQPVPAPPVAAPIGPDSAASRQATARNEAPDVAAGTTANLASDASPPRIVPTTAPPGGATAVPPSSPVSTNAAPSAPDRSTAPKSASRTEPRRTVVRTAQRTGSDEKVARKPRETAATSAKLGRLLSQIDGWSRESAPEGWRAATAHGRTVQKSAENDALIDDQQAVTPVPSSGAAFRPKQLAMREARSPVQNLLSARRALADHNPSAARGLLEAAETSIVFDAGAPERAGIAATQIGNALGLLNSGDIASAMPYVERAITAMGPTS